jgi:integrase
VLAPSTLSVIYNGYVVAMFASAVVDRLIGVSPCVAIRLPKIEGTVYHIANPGQVHALHDALPARYRAIPYVAAGCGWRGGEVFGLEHDAVDFQPREIHVRHQLKVISGRKPFLALPKTKASKRTNELPELVSRALAQHMKEFPPSLVDIDDETDPRKPVRRQARLVFTNNWGEPIHRASWSHVWQAAVKTAGLPVGYGLRDLRHYFATVLIFGGANVKTVQLALGHTTPMTTLNTYVGLWPDAVDRTRTLVDRALGCTEVVPTVAP